MMIMMKSSNCDARILPCGVIHMVAEDKDNEENDRKEDLYLMTVSNKRGEE